jgi:hypothetical protein
MLHGVNALRLVISTLAEIRLVIFPLSRWRERVGVRVALATLSRRHSGGGGNPAFPLIVVPAEAGNPGFPLIVIPAEAGNPGFPLIVIPAKAGIQ